MIVIMENEKESAEHIKMLLCMECGFRETAVNIFSKSSANLLNVIKNDKKRTINIVIIDISMNSNFDGIILAEQIVSIRADMHIVFVTSYGKFYIQQAFLFSYDVVPVAYLLKPVNKYFLKKTIEKIRYIDRNQSTVWIKTQRTMIGVKSSDIIYIGIEGHCTVFYTEEETYKSYSSIEDVAKSLPNGFLRCHKSFIINTDYIGEYNSRSSFILKNDTPIPISRAYQSHVKKFMEQIFE